MRRLLIKIYHLITPVGLWPLTVNAQEGGTGLNPLGRFSSIKDIPTLIDKILDIIVQIGLPVVAVAIVIVGFMFVKARGNEQELTTAKQAFLWVVIGAAVVLGAQVLSTAIQSTVVQLGS